MKQISLSIFLFGIFLTAIPDSYGASSELFDARAARVVGGRKVSAADPIAATTVAFLNGDALCTGSIVDDDLMVTAAHCLESGKFSKMRVVFSRVLAEGAYGAKVLGAAVAPGWLEEDAADTGDWGDIALVRFGGGLPEGYSKVYIDREERDLRDGEDVIIAGYGISDAEADTGDGVLRKAEVPVKRYEFGRTEMLLDQSFGSGACHGDSGGPALIKRHSRLHLVGITSRGYPANSPDDCAHDAVFTKIAPYADWLVQAARALRKR